VPDVVLIEHGVVLSDLGYQQVNRPQMLLYLDSDRVIGRALFSQLILEVKDSLM
jgi:hypothetical protein